MRTDKSTELICPSCKVQLHLDRTLNGYIWICHQCKGTAANLAVLRKRLRAHLVSDFWRTVQMKGLPTARPCPVCHRTMTAFKFQQDHDQLLLDLCKRCQFVWFDGGELESLSRAYKPKEDLPAELKQQHAIWKIQQQNQFQAELEQEADRLLDWYSIARIVLRLLNRFVLKVWARIEMETQAPTRQQALTLLKSYNKSEALIRHALAVEAVMRHMAKKFGEDQDIWGIVGLIHDLDYEQFPDQHCTKTAEILRFEGWPEHLIRAAISHGWDRCSQVEPQNLMAKALYAVDELTGLVAATVLVRPSRSSGT